MRVTVMIMSFVSLVALQIVCDVVPQDFLCHSKGG